MESFGVKSINKLKETLFYIPNKMGRGARDTLAASITTNPMSTMMLVYVP